MNTSSTHNGAKWCYVDRRERLCPDLRPSVRYSGQQWSTHACSTPAQTDRLCTGASPRKTDPRTRVAVATNTNSDAP